MGSRQVERMAGGVFQKHKWRSAAIGCSKEISICAVLERVSLSMLLGLVWERSLQRGRMERGLSL